MREQAVVPRGERCRAAQRATTENAVLQILSIGDRLFIYCDSLCVGRRQDLPVSSSVKSCVPHIADSRLDRYTDEGETYELCRWSVNLSSLPAFQQNAQQATGGFYTEFDLSIALDSAEVTGTLLDDEGEECGRAVFEYTGR